MSKAYYMTPEEKVKKKKRDKVILYATFVAATAVISSALTILMNQM